VTRVFRDREKERWEFHNLKQKASKAGRFWYYDTIYTLEQASDIGIEFTDGDSYDFAWIGQASFMNKKVSLKQSTEEGLEFLSKITGDYMLFDGQDAST